MKTILVVYTNEKLTVNKINNSKLRKYAFRIEDNVEEGDILKSSIYSSNMIVTDVIDNDFKYFNSQSGELSNEIKSTMCYPIKTIELREENTNVVYAQKIEDNSNNTTK